ncbi:hypothetical protein A9K65_013850 [Mesorhizobium sp. WSM1497]|uniref:hypothetical protein n=1 Tax=Mesorhizobium sp. WSM1497 TaxID=278153 RepID=UPI0007EC6ACD|nr:hypothetical protein [Mesorhizobium sp. WSM1497]ARP64345.1 hypothetical protein A9K65_013850 [Mesorhizobium sp. WSM1497]
MLRTIYHVKDGAKEMYDIDARAAVAQFPKEWSETAWPEKGSKPSKADQELQAASDALADAEKALADAKSDDDKKAATAARDRPRPISTRCRPRPRADARRSPSRPALLMEAQGLGPGLFAIVALAPAFVTTGFITLCPSSFYQVYVIVRGGKFEAERLFPTVATMSARQIELEAIKFDSLGIPKRDSPSS